MLEIPSIMVTGLPGASLSSMGTDSAIVMMFLTAISVLLEPVFAKLLKRVNTSINVEDNGEIATIDISEED